MSGKTPTADTQLQVVLEGDQRAVENLILEVRAIAQRLGHDISDIQIVQQPKVKPKTPRRAKRR